ncbi:dipeptidyl-peptidase 3 family protein [Pontibacter ramchanderi]|uniref:Peptidase M49-like protein n=1 Tax=Pontibacter ramchanderi TaxID=1179743 RepID=A0A2N3U971_9BACT|nr:Zn-dependent hydrolase [Pontibacter ramchanderi]PKV63285.1 peptidase M49-like protein [Pontibacter ramchanderi]
MRSRHLLLVSAVAALTAACTGSTTNEAQTTEAVQTDATATDLQQKLGMYTSVRLTSDLSGLSEKERQMIPLLIEASNIMDELFWYEAYGKKDSLLNALTDDAAKQFVKINYGPWDRLNNNEPFLPGVGPKPDAANFYPQDMTKEEFEKANLKDKTSQYTFLRRDANGQLITVPYHVQFKEQVKRASDLLRQAANLADEPGLKKYLTLRADALLNDNYQPSDLAWMDMKNNRIDVVIGPIETYEDKVFGYKAAHEAYVLIKDMDWSKRLEKYAAFLPELQRGLPVPANYKKETPGTDSDLNAYDVVYYAGDCNAGSKTIAINLPNDEEVQLKKGTRRLQLKNAMQAKFDKIMLPIADELIADDQMQHITFDAFFANTMFHEVAHGLGIKNTINGKGTVREALKEHASALEEGKADILGLYMITQLHKKGEVSGSLEDYYTTFMAGIFRSVRFGAASAHGKANMVRFNFFKENGAFERDAQTGKYRVNYVKMGEAMDKLSELILTLQGNGDYAGVGKLLNEQGLISAELQADLDRLSQKNIPVDVVFEQGVDVLGLK